MLKDTKNLYEAALQEALISHSIYIYTYLFIVLLMYQLVPTTQDDCSSYHLLSNGDPLLALVHKWRLSEAQFLSSAFDSG